MYIINVYLYLLLYFVLQHRPSSNFDSGVECLQQTFIKPPHSSWQWITMDVLLILLIWIVVAIRYVCVCRYFMSYYYECTVVRATVKLNIQYVSRSLPMCTAHSAEMQMMYQIYCIMLCRRARPYLGGDWGF